MSAWKRFPVPEFNHRELKRRPFAAPDVIDASEIQRVAEAAEAGEMSVAGGYSVKPDGGLLEKLAFRGDHTQMFLCALPMGKTRLLARSYAWFNQRVFLLSANTPDAAVVHNWRTPRPNNTRFGPEDGVELDQKVIFLLSGRILDDHTRGNRVMFDTAWKPSEGIGGFRLIAACDPGEDNFHDACFEFTWAA